MVLLRYPSRIIFAKGALNNLGQETLVFGQKALLVTGGSAMRKAGVLDNVCRQLQSENITVNLFEGVESDPSLETVDKGTDLARKQKASVVIGLGGGSVIDAAKSIAIMVPRKEKVKDYFYKRAVQTPGIPFIAVPTTAGTGAEITCNAVLTDPKGKIKKSLRSPFMMAKVVLVDPGLTLFCPPHLTACSGMDALTQAVECFISRASNPITDTLALRAIEILFVNLPLAVKKGSDIQIREKVTLGSLLQAMAFSNAGLGAVHGLSHPLGAYHHIPHGLACAVLLPHILQCNLCVCREKMGIIAKKINVGKSENLPQVFRELLGRINLPSNFKQWNIKKEDIPCLVTNSRSNSMSKNPRDLSDEKLTQILEKVI